MLRCTEQGNEFGLKRTAGYRNVHNLWNVDELFRRPLVILGLTPGELRRLAKKGAAAGDTMQAQTGCERFLLAAETVNALSCRMSRLLRRKYDREAGPARELSEEQFLLRWREAVSTGNCGALLWAAATRELSVGALLVVSRDIARLLCEAASHEPQEHLRLRMESRLLRHELETLRVAARGLEDENEGLKALMLSATGACETRQAFLPSLQHREGRRCEVRMRRPLLETGAGGCCDRACNETCPSFNVCRKRVLIVGGVERMEALYRQVIEGGGGELDYHSGSLQGGTRQLEKSLRRADIILCPVNCNSHGACIKVKNLAKKHNKTCYLLPNGSMSTISKLLRNGEGQQVDMN